MVFQISQSEVPGVSENVGRPERIQKANGFWINCDNILILASTVLQRNTLVSCKNSLKC